MLAVGDMRPVRRLCRLKWDQRFESAFLQRGVSCEPDFRSESPSPGPSSTTRESWPAAAPGICRGVTGLGRTYTEKRFSTTYVNDSPLLLCNGCTCLHSQSNMFVGGPDRCHSGRYHYNSSTFADKFALRSDRILREKSLPVGYILVHLRNLSGFRSRER
jgi:hypothetical protein